MTWTRGRTVNAVVWLYLWLSQTLHPVITAGDYWTEKAKQLVRFGPFDDIPRLVGQGVIPLVLWFVIDRILRRRARRKAMAEPLPE